MKARLYLFFSSTEGEEKTKQKGLSSVSVLRERLNLHPKLLRNFPSILKKKRVKLSKKEKKKFVVEAQRRRRRRKKKAFEVS